MGAGLLTSLYTWSPPVARLAASSVRNSGRLSLLTGMATYGADMDKDRIKGSAEQAKGKVKEVAGKLTGDAKLEGEGKAETVSYTHLTLPTTPYV